MFDRATNILLIEDDATYVELLGSSLEQNTLGFRFKLEVTPTLKAAFTRLAAGGVDIVLADLNLPDSSGLKTLQKLHSKAPDIPVIILSGQDDPQMETDAIHMGAQDYLVKGEAERKLVIRSIRYALEREAFDSELREAQNKYRSIYENTVEGIFQTTMEGKYLMANPALARIYGYDSPEDLMKSMTDIAEGLYVKPGRREEFIRLMRWHQVVTNFESEVRRKDGNTIWISENVRAVRDRHGKFLYYEGTSTDITERKEAEQRLVNSESLYHSLVETLPQFIFRKDLMERFTFGNQRFCTMMGTAPEDLLGKTDFDFFPPDLAQKYQDDDRNVMETGELFETVETVQPPGKDPSYVNVVKTPLRDPEGKIIGLQGIFWDITERVVAEQREREANEALAISREELRLKNEQLEKDQAMAREIQQAFFTSQYPVFPADALPQHSEIQFYHRYLPAGTVSGDFFNVMQINDKLAGVFISDVMGHGVRSALITAMLRALLEELRPIANDPGEFLTHLNLDLRTILRQSGTPMFTTAFYLLIDLEKNEFRFANAGHPKPLLIRQESDGATYIANNNGQPQPAMGLFDQTNYLSSSKPFEKGDTVILYTDGLIEIENDDGEWYDSEKLLASISSKNHSQRLNDVCDAVLNDIKEFAQTDAFEDDVCLLGVKIS